MQTETFPLKLVVTDWALDPHAVVAACSREVEVWPAAFALLVPAWLHGVGWTGDPKASGPCAQRHLDRLLELSADAGIDVVAHAVGDPDPATAIGDAVRAWSPSEVLLCLRRRPRLASRNPLSLLHRAERISGLPVSHVGEATRAVVGPCR
jgi:hypothetical protein